MINLSKHFTLTSLNSSWFLALWNHFAKFQSIFTQLAADEAAHLGCIVARECLWLGAHWYETILACQVGNTAEGTTIVERVLEEELHLRVFDALLAQVDDALQHEVSLLQLVVEEEIILWILHHSALLVVEGEVRTEHIETAEHPAAAGTLLVVDALRWCLDAEMSINRSLVGMVLYQVIDVVSSDGIEECLVGSTAILALRHLLNHRFTDAANLGLRHHR